MERAEFYASCGLETTVFETSFLEESGVTWLDVKMKFAPTLIRQTVPGWCSVVFKMRPPRDIRYYHALMFRLEPVMEEGSGDCGLKQLVVELHGANTHIPFEYRPVGLEAGVAHATAPLITVPLQGMNPEVLKQTAEFCFVANLGDLYRVEEDCPAVLGCHFRIAQIRLN